MDPIYINEDMNPKWDGATGVNSTTGATTSLNAATVTYTLTGPNGSTVTTGTCDYIAASAGDYLGVILASVTANLVAGSLYTLTQVLVQSPYQGSRTTKYRATMRGKN